MKRYMMLVLVASLPACFAHRGGQTTAHTTVKAKGPVVVSHITTETTADASGKVVSTKTTKDSTFMSPAAAEYDLKKDEIIGNTKVGEKEAENRWPKYPPFIMGRTPWQGPGYYGDRLLEYEPKQGEPPQCWGYENGCAGRAAAGWRRRP